LAGSFSRGGLALVPSARMPASRGGAGNQRMAMRRPLPSPTLVDRPDDRPCPIDDKWHDKSLSQVVTFLLTGDQAARYSRVQVARRSTYAEQAAGRAAGRRNEGGDSRVGRQVALERGSRWN
jgi:hypothetical protein